MSRPGWYQISRGVTGGISSLYHHLDPKAATTACGQKLGDVFGYFRATAHTRQQRAKLRCAQCVHARLDEGFLQERSVTS